ncbi:hypothetical protein BC936DRAFT_138627 [Jimgerdemannia flammicorona]|uniref:Mitochondrial outer membrane transport complex Sam37/metaxin N-terminal domain-containing protein n=1 Tax=Jimgerdemannia flammicorona TaxID=994334 RepID=A0A433DIF3_9FUNG|nr:hypothetical protein BC936DRAFT_138627 [Jimgerdemannia flammicorona]
MAPAGGTNFSASTLTASSGRPISPSAESTSACTTATSRSPRPPVKTRYCAPLRFCFPQGKLPFLAMPTGETLYDEQITFWLRKNETEKKLAEDSEDAEATAFISLAETKLRTALLFSFFLEPRNMSEATGPKYFGHYAKPIDAIIQHRKKNAIIQRMLAKRALLVADEVSIRDRALGLILATRKPKAFSNMHRIIRHIHVYRLTVSRADIYFSIKVYQDAADALLSFSTKLGDEQYFFGSSHPTFLDATVFAYLHTILVPPQIAATEENADDATRLRELVMKHDNLVNFARNVYKTWWTPEKAR